MLKLKKFTREREKKTTKNYFKERIIKISEFKYCKIHQIRRINYNLALFHCSINFCPFPFLMQFQN